MYEKSEMEPDIYNVEAELRIIVCRGCYSSATTLADNC